MSTTASVAALRRRAKKVSLRFYKSTWRKDTIDNRGKYQVLNTWTNFVVEGDRYDADIEAVERCIRREEERMNPSK